MSLREKFWKTVEDDIMNILEEYHGNWFEDSSQEQADEITRNYAKRIINHVLKGHD